MAQFEEQLAPLRVEQYGEYTANIDGHGYHLPTTYVVNQTARNNGADGMTFFFGGLGEGDMASLHTMAVLDYMDVAAATLYMPFIGVPPTKPSLVKVAKELPNQFAEDVLKEFGVHSSEEIIIGGNSLGAAVSVLAAEENPALYDKVLVLSGLGLNRGDYLPAGGEPTQAELTDASDALLKRLVLKNSLYAAQWPLHLLDRSQPVWDGGVLRGNTEVLVNVLSALKRRTIIPQIQSGVSLDLIPSVHSLITQHGIDVRAYYGEHDPVFPAASTKRNLGSVGLEHILRTIPTSHNVLMSSPGTRALKFVAEDAMGGKDPASSR